MATVKEVRTWLATKPDDYVVEFCDPDMGEWMTVDADISTVSRKDGTKLVYTDGNLRAVPLGTPAYNATTRNSIFVQEVKP